MVTFPVVGTTVKIKFTDPIKGVFIWEAKWDSKHDGKIWRWRFFFNRDKITRQDKGLFIWEEELSVWLKLLRMSWKDCYVARRIFENLVFLNFEWIFFFFYFFILATLVGCFFKERMINKQETALNYGATFFIPGWSVYLKTIVPAVPGSHQAGTKWKTFRLYINVVKSLRRNGYNFLISFIVLSHSLSRPGSHINSP